VRLHVGSLVPPLQKMVEIFEKRAALHVSMLAPYGPVELVKR
jgi:hypothetical protein